MFPRRTPQFPRRHPWLAAIAGTVLLVLAVRLAWGWWVERNVQNVLDDLRRSGQPTSVADLRFPTVPDSENAWLVQKQALDSQTLERALELVRQSRQRPRAQIRAQLTYPVPVGALNYMNDARNLAHVAINTTTSAYSRTSDTEAIELLLDAMHLVRSLHHDDFILAHMLANSVQASVCDRVFAFAPRLRFDDATRRSTRQLIQQLLDEEVARTGLVRANSVARALALDDIRNESKGLWLTHPLAGIETVRLSRKYDLALRAARTESWPQAKALLSQTELDAFIIKKTYPPDPARDSRRYSRWFAQPQDTQSDINDHFQALHDRRLAAIALACQLYRDQHGKLPTTLDQLVPTYLPAIPRDPAAADGRPIEYATWRQRQYPFMRNPPPSPQTVNDNPKKPDQPSQDTEVKKRP